MNKTADNVTTQAICFHNDDVCVGWNEKENTASITVRTEASIPTVVNRIVTTFKISVREAWQLSEWIQLTLPKPTKTSVDGD